MLSQNNQQAAQQIVTPDESTTHVVQSPNNGRAAQQIVTPDESTAHVAKEYPIAHIKPKSVASKVVPIGLVQDTQLLTNLLLMEDPTSGSNENQDEDEI